MLSAQVVPATYDSLSLSKNIQLIVDELEGGGMVCAARVGFWGSSSKQYTALLHEDFGQSLR